MRVCVFCSSSERADASLTDLAHRVGGAIAHRGHALVYGGTAMGLMARLAAAAHDGGAHVTGIVPTSMRGLVDPVCDEVVVTDTLAARKVAMMARSDAFLVLPGGLGTLDELLEVVTHRQLGEHALPIALLGVGGFWAPFVGVLVDLARRGLAGDPATLLHATEDLEAAFAHLETGD
jgi:uncharacterized protein (TIGR00730 family)